jgi:hypothetical protein
VVGLRLQLNGDRLTKTAETGEAGFAQFRNIPPGEYFVSAALDGGMPDGASINVTAQGPNNTTVSLKWPRRTPILVSAFRGILRWPAVQGDPKNPAIQIELLDARTGRSQKKIQSSESGAFDFGKTEPGLYVLRVSGSYPSIFKGQPLSGNILVEVDPLAPQSELDLEIGWSSCGIHYVDRHTCPREDLSIETLTGQVLDPSGASIARAVVSLYNTEQQIAEQQVSDEIGNFSSTKQLNGTYQLIISSPGFTPLRRTVKASSPKGKERPARLEVQLGVAGACSNAALLGVQN